VLEYIVVFLPVKTPEFYAGQKRQTTGNIGN
jgi:hypothetical protein